MGDTPPRLFEQAKEVVRQAGRIILDHWDKPRQIRSKGRINLVTETDLAVELALKRDLGELLPEATFLAEETTSNARPGSLTWIIDPLDGTTNFAHSLPFVAISVALWAENQIQMGLVYSPMLQEFFTAHRGKGAFLNEQAIAVSKTALLEEAVVATGFPYAINEHVRPILTWMERALLSCRGLRRFGSAAMDLAYVACGRLDGFYEIALNPWDTAAGWLLVEEAGGCVGQMQTGVNAPYFLGAETILATNGKIHPAMHAMLAEGC